MELCVDAVVEVDTEDEENDEEGKNEHVADRMVLFLVLHHFYPGVC